jgi:hypothetical protein
MLISKAPFATSLPSEKWTRAIWPLTCDFMATLVKASILPIALTWIGMSFCSACAIFTGTFGFAFGISFLAEQAEQSINTMKHRMIFSSSFMRTSFLMLNYNKYKTLQAELSGDKSLHEAIGICQ